MAAQTPQEATTAAACYSCIPSDMQMPVLIYLFNQISGLMATPSELVSAAACYSCIPRDMQMPTLISLAAQIAAGGGGGTTCGVVDPVDPPSGTCGLYYNITSASFWAWNNSTLAWEKYIG